MLLYTGCRTSRFGMSPTPALPSVITGKAGSYKHLFLEQDSSSNPTAENEYQNWSVS